MSLCLFILTDFCRLRILRHKHLTVLTTVICFWFRSNHCFYIWLLDTACCQWRHCTVGVLMLRHRTTSSSFSPAYSVDNNAPATSATLCHTTLTILPWPTTSYHQWQAPMTAICSAPICSPVPDVQTGLHCVPCSNISTISQCTGLRHPTSTSLSSFSGQCCSSHVEVYKFL